MLLILDLARENTALKLELKAIRQRRADRACRWQGVPQWGVQDMATTYQVNLFIQVPDEGEPEVWQVE